MKTAVVIMSRIPEPGFTKTRLLGKISGDECADLHRACLRDICLAVRKTEMASFLYYVGLNDPPEPDWLNSVFDPWGLQPEDYLYFTMYRQEGIDLGERMLNSARQLLPDYDAVIFLGSDMPCISPQLLLEANERLQEHDLVIGPAEDGGYYLLALKRVYEELFEDIPWSTGNVLQMTLQAAQKCGLSNYRLPTNSDIDTWEDLLSFYKKGLIDKELTELDSYKYTEYLIEKAKEGEPRYGCIDKEDS